STAGVVHPAPSRGYNLHGEEGDDALIGSSALATTLYGGPGHNSFVVGPASTTISSTSSTDAIVGNGSDNNHRVYDETSPRFGGRTIGGFAPGGAASHVAVGSQNDAVVRIRPGATAGTAVTTHSLDRRGQQRIPEGFAEID